MVNRSGHHVPCEAFPMSKSPPHATDEETEASLGDFSKGLTGDGLYGLNLKCPPKILCVQRWDFQKASESWEL